ncbi:alcohol dehydrogenase catalytic domain-containing protein [Microbulbifer magnicolonia]|uniref:alcohol dehydrogenase catalytic domain-containing protein n=1 Tax=Microbulbifer magnicolonia TaxID=3109744 RepID=UPI002B40B0BE|nr:alcohol dehydrogenase catalytic domain-containing protein [Microbulbifer sp. GG15]
MATNRAVAYMGPRKLEIQNLDFPKLVDPRGKPCHHGVILKIVTANICGSDQHIYRGRFPAPKGMILGHENTGEVLEVGRDVEFLKKGDLVSVPFNVSCGRCRNCRERHTEVCMNVNPDIACGAYGFNLGGWQGGQADYMMVPYADFALLKFPDKEQAMAKIKDLTLLSDILPTGFHGCVIAGVRTGSSVYIAGAGPVGRCAAASARLLGASCIIVGDTNKQRLDLVKKAGYEVVDLSKNTPLPDQIEAIFGEREVDCGVDCVGFEAHGHGSASGEEDPTAVLNGLFEVVRAGGGMGIPGIYTAGDPEAKTEAVKQGTYNLDFGKAWIKSPSLTGGQCPVVKYSRDLMLAILWDRMPYLSEVMNIEVVPLEKAPEAYRMFDEGSPKKFVLDPHGSVRG